MVLESLRLVLKLVVVAVGGVIVLCGYQLGPDPGRHEAVSSGRHRDDGGVSSPRSWYLHCPMHRFRKDGFWGPAQYATRSGLVVAWSLKNSNQPRQPLTIRVSMLISWATLDDDGTPNNS